MDYENEVIIIDNNGIVLNKKKIGKKDIFKFKNETYILNNTPTFKYVSGILFKKIVNCYVFRKGNAMPLKLEDVKEYDSKMINTLLEIKIMEEIKEDKGFKFDTKMIIYGLIIIVSLYLLYSFSSSFNKNKGVNSLNTTKVMIENKTINNNENNKKILIVKKLNTTINKTMIAHINNTKNMVSA